MSILGPLGIPGTLGPGRREIQTCHNKNFFMLKVRAYLRPLLFLRTPHVGWEKWSRNCSNSKHSRDITIVSLVTQWIIPGNLNFPPARTQSTQSAQRTQYRHFSSGIALPSLVYLYSLTQSCSRVSTNTLYVHVSLVVSQRRAGIRKHHFILFSCTCTVAGLTTSTAMLIAL